MERNRMMFGCSLAVGLLLAACSDDSSPSRSSVIPRTDSGVVQGGLLDAGSVPTEPEPDFTLADTNPTSPRAGEMVSPRDYLQKVTGWYFTHSS